MATIKAWMLILVLLVILAWTFYTWLLDNMDGAVSGINNGFIARIPWELLAIIWIIILALLMGIAYALFTD